MKKNLYSHCEGTWCALIDQEYNWPKQSSMHQRSEHIGFKTEVIFISFSTGGVEEKLLLHGNGGTLINTIGDVEMDIGSIIAESTVTHIGAVVMAVEDIIGCSGIVVDGGVILEVALVLKVLDC